MIRTLLVAVSLFRPYPEAVTQHDLTQKPLVVHIGATWCHQCPPNHERLEKLVAAEFRDQVILTEWDYDKDRNFVDTVIGERVVPQTVVYFIGKDGKMHVRLLVGSATTKELRGLIAPTISATAGGTGEKK